MGIFPRSHHILFKISIISKVSSLKWNHLKSTHIKFIGDFSVFLEVQTAMVVQFYGVIHVIEEAQKMGAY